jgi:nicotine blue oxidoreductase
MKTAAIVLAAGEGRRMGRAKALLSLEGSSFLALSCRRLARPGVSLVVAVVGAEAERVRTHAGVPTEVEIVENERWREGMLSSVWRGLDAAEEKGAEAVLLHPVDHPFVDPHTVDRVVAALARGAFVAVPTHGGRRGHPGGFGREAVAALRSAPSDRGARAVLEAHPDRVVHVEGDPGCVTGVNTPADYRRLLSFPR